MRKLLLLIIILFMISCEKNKEPQKKFVVGEGYGLYFSYLDVNGNDMLNPTHPNTLTFEAIRVYYIKNGIKEEVILNNQSEYPRGIRRFCDWPDQENCILSITLSDTTVLDFGHQFSDTISYNEYTGIITYNGEVVWDYDRDGYRIPIATIVK